MMTLESLNGPTSFIWQLQHIAVPVIAAVAGACMTGGLELALNTDVIVASRSAVFRDTHTMFGIVPGGGMTQLLPRIVGLQNAKWMSLTAAKVDAQHAAQMGLACMVRHKPVAGHQIDLQTWPRRCMMAIVYCTWLCQLQSCPAVLYICALQQRKAAVAAGGRGG